MTITPGKRGPRVCPEILYALELMKQDGMTQDKAAKIAQVSQQSISYHLTKAKKSATQTPKSNP